MSGGGLSRPIKVHNNPINDIDPVGLFVGFINELASKKAEQFSNDFINSGHPILAQAFGFMGELQHRSAGFDPIYASVKKAEARAAQVKRDVNLVQSKGLVEGGKQALQEHADIAVNELPVVGPIRRAMDPQLAPLERAGEVSQAISDAAGLLALAKFAAPESVPSQSTALVKYDPGFALRQGANPSTVVPDTYAVIRGGTKPVPRPGETFSTFVGPTIEEAGANVPHPKVRATTAGDIRQQGGTVELYPEAPAGSSQMNYNHAHVTEGGETTVFSEPIKKSD